MTLFRFLTHKYVAYKYKRDNLRIIQAIPANRFEQIVKTYAQDGWEVTGTYDNFDAAREHWLCSLRKGNSILKCQWNKAHLASISGPARIINALGKELQLDVRLSPRL